MHTSPAVCREPVEINRRNEPVMENLDAPMIFGLEHSDRTDATVTVPAGDPATGTVQPMKRGDKVDEFELQDQTGTARSLTSLLTDGPIVLFFYPAAMTPGCTKEACHFRDLASEFAAVGANRVGISTDAVDKQAKFAEQQNFDYPLLSDSDGAVATQFDVKRGLLGKLMPVKRTTFVIDTDRTVLEVIASELSMDTHADKALEVLRQRQSA